MAAATGAVPPECAPNRGTGSNTFAVLRQSVSIAPLPIGQRKILHCIIGSGPAGVACARALLACGANVLMLDAGLELEPERARVVSKLASAKPPECNRNVRQQHNGLGP